MRVVRDAESFEDAFKNAVSEAKTAFGDGTVFVERFLDKPKHIEAQLLGDSSGNVVHLFERDCSVQRRHQKVVEQGPATNLSEEMRAQLLADAVKIAKAVNYRNAGTCEFLVDSRGYYFIEINPRIQVEHTVSEEITGIDIIAAQIQVSRDCVSKGALVANLRPSLIHRSLLEHLFLNSVSLKIPSRNVDTLFNAESLPKIPLLVSNPTLERSKFTVQQVETVFDWMPVQDSLELKSL